MRWDIGLLVVCVLGLAGCDGVGALGRVETRSLADARKGFSTRIVSSGPRAEPAPKPPQRLFNMVHYESPVGPLVAYVTPDPGDEWQYPGIIWITGGDNNSIGNVWKTMPRNNDQSARAYREAGVIMMFPSQRGGNDNPGRREGFYGEVDDILAAADYLASLPYVDEDRLYLGGHSTGGTLAMLVAQMSDRFQATFAFGPVSSPDQYGGEFLYCDPNNSQEVKLRAPYFWLRSVKKPLYVFEGGNDGNWPVIEVMQQVNKNPLVQFIKLPQFNHFTVLGPVNEVLAPQVRDNYIKIDVEQLRNLR